ncbi:enoyl-CoA hydratase-related protein [Hydrogenophaga sp. BPS33]|uniref:enoyl-CoA hydratase-related protein n=1 Tax=Hydrogenophaga sp. BPS33 TaxID=2651974 RepID=UPI00131F7EBF|nr:enoyl-CoA hydratase-related protein [Hydrogenophaga sp. BPS33]QHE84507.1 enoyl-CoA hydratase [Hydrogenophaga sp. BPS33]
MKNDATSQLVVTRDTVDPHVMVVTIDRPPVNPLTLAMFERMTELFAGLHKLPDVRAVVLTGAGIRVFCAGADVKELGEKTLEISMQRSAVTRATFEAIRKSPVPVIAAVNGSAIGAGLVLAACCDVVMAAQGTKFALPEVTVGTMGGARHAATLLPEKMVRFMVLTGEHMMAEDLHRIGSVHMVLPHDELMPQALAMARRMASKAPTVMRLARESITLAFEMPVYEGYRLEQLFTGLAAGLPESREAALAWAEKRKPSWLA